MKYIASILICFSLNANASLVMENKDHIVLTLQECKSMEDAFIAFDPNKKMLGCWKGTEKYIIILWDNKLLINYEYKDWKLHETK